MTTAPEDAHRIAGELAAREPIFHRPEFGTRREDFDRLMATDFSEVGASGATYSREFVLETLVERHRHPVVERLVVSDFACRQVAPALWLASYRLEQDGDRVSRRSTLWRRTSEGWQIVHHQGTLVSAGQAR